MEPFSIPELHEKIRAILRKSAGDPLARCLVDQLEIVLQSLEGWDALSGLITQSDL
ncbi:MAG: hypothetical protein ACYTHM_23850 [Planctomycetota bacterium]|jgi:DNA-binding response OmpR family regulator